MFSKGFKFFEPFTAALSSSSLYKVRDFRKTPLFSKVSILLLFTVFLSPVTFAHCLDLSFVWDANTEHELAGYRVFYRQEGQNYDYNNPYWEGTETTCTIFDLDDNTRYYFVSRAYDIYDNESENSVELCYEPGMINASYPIPPTVTSSESGDGAGGCFIATAAYGSLMEPHVRLLRQFRDRFLLTNAVGRTFVRLYYIYSPPIAEFIVRHESLRAIIRRGLLPFVGISWGLLRFGFLPTTLVLLFLSTTISVYLISMGRFRKKVEKIQIGLKWMQFFYFKLSLKK